MNLYKIDLNKTLVFGLFCIASLASAQQNFVKPCRSALAIRFGLEIGATQKPGFTEIHFEVVKIVIPLW